MGEYCEIKRSKVTTFNAHKCITVADVQHELRTATTSFKSQMVE